MASDAVRNIQDVREGGLDMLTELCKADDEVAGSIVNVIAGGIQSVITRLEDSDRFATAAVKFIDRIAPQGKGGPFAKVIFSAVIPKLVEAILDWELNSSDRSWLAAPLEFPDVEHAVLGDLHELLFSDQFADHRSFYTVLNLLDVKRWGQRRVSCPLAALWPSSDEFVQDAVSTLFETLVKLSVQNPTECYFLPRVILVLVARDDRFRSLSPPPNYLEEIGRTSSGTTRDNTVEVLKSFALFAERIMVSDELLKKLLGLALEDIGEDVRTAALQLASNLPQNPNTVASFAMKAKEKITPNLPKLEIGSRFLEELWVSLIVSIAKHGAQFSHLQSNCADPKVVPFPESIPFLIQRATSARAGSGPKNKIMEFLASKQFTSDSAAFEALGRSIPKNLGVIGPTLGEDVATMRRWAEVLGQLHSIGLFASSFLLQPPASLKVQDSLHVAAEALSRMKMSVMGLLDTAGTVAEEDTEGGRKEPTECTYPVGSTLPDPLLITLEKSSEGQRMHWVGILTTFAATFPGEFQNTPAVLLSISVGDPDSDVRREALQSLCSLASTGKSGKDLLAKVKEKINRLAQDDDWNIRFLLIQLIAALQKSNTDKLDEEVFEKLTKMALVDQDYDVRSELVGLLATQIADVAMYPQKSLWAWEKFDEGIKDWNWKLRQSWVKFIASQLESDEGSGEGPDHSSRSNSIVDARGVRDVFSIACEDSDARVQDSASEILEQALKGVSTKARNSMISQLRDVITLYLKKNDLSKSVTNALAKLTLPTSKDDRPQQGERVPSLVVRASSFKQGLSDGKVAGHRTWIQIIVLLAQNEYDGVPKLVEWALKEGPTASFDNLGPLFKQVKLSVPVDTALPRSIESALKIDSTTTSDTRSAAVELVSRLTGMGMCFGHDGMKDGADYEGVLGKDKDVRIVARVADIAVKDPDTNLRKSALKLLKSLFIESAKHFSTFVRQLLPTAMDMCFKDSEQLKYRSNAVEILQNLTETSAAACMLEPCAIYCPSKASPSSRRLLQAILHLRKAQSNCLSTGNKHSRTHCMTPTLLTLAPQGDLASTTVVYGTSGNCVLTSMGLGMPSPVSIVSSPTTSCIRSSAYVLTNERFDAAVHAPWRQHHHNGTGRKLAVSIGEDPNPRHECLGILCIANACPDTTDPSCSSRLCGLLGCVSSDLSLRLISSALSLLSLLSLRFPSSVLVSPFTLHTSRTIPHITAKQETNERAHPS
ncbi:hypothetical protein NMY22_g9749 [Coprinellus aureogranulatus]|nr:hypothetical protein NMY22_g9749 [Coprinellus aureogranulatus]